MFPDLVHEIDAPTGTDRPWGFIIEGFAPLAA
jgi:hypothetical protein